MRQCRPCSPISGSPVRSPSAMSSSAAASRALRSSGAQSTTCEAVSATATAPGSGSARAAATASSIERPSARLGRRIGESDSKPGEQPHPKRSPVRLKALERFLEERDERLVDRHDRHAESGGAERRTREQVVARLRASQPRRLLERDPSAIGLARAQARVAEWDENLGQPSRCRPAAGKYLGTLEQLDRVLPGQPLDGLSPGRQRARDGGLGVRPGTGERVVRELGQPMLGRTLGPLGQHPSDAAVEVGAARGRNCPTSASRTSAWTNASRSVPAAPSRNPPAGRRRAHPAPAPPIRPSPPARAPRRTRSRRLRRARAAVARAPGAGRHVQRRPRFTASGRHGLPLPRVLRKLANEERVPTGSLAQRAGGGRIRARPRQRLDDRGNRRIVEPVQGHSDDRPVAPDLGKRVRERVARAPIDVPGAASKQGTR